MEGLTRENCSEIGFVKACFISGAINHQELRDWAEHIISSRDDYPPYIVDVLEFDAPKPQILKTIGFTPSADLSPSGSETIRQIAFRRHGVEQGLDLPRYSCNQTLERFNQVFGFLSDTPIVH